MNIVVLTGAGISAESGLATFRSADGLWEKHRIEDVATPEGFARNKDLVHSFYNARRRQLREAQPNEAHRALASFEKGHSGSFLVISQNIDDLHQRAGTASLISMHGELLKARCENCAVILTCLEDLDTASLCTACHSAGALRPHVVWFGEEPLLMREIDQALSSCDLFLSIGTSGNVYPAAAFVQTARCNNAHCVELNLERTDLSPFFDEVILGPASQKLPLYLDTLAGAESL